MWFLPKLQYIYIFFKHWKNIGGKRTLSAENSEKYRSKKTSKRSTRRQKETEYYSCKGKIKKIHPKCMLHIFNLNILKMYDFHAILLCLSFQDDQFSSHIPVITKGNDSVRQKSTEEHFWTRFFVSSEQRLYSVFIQ